MFNVLGTNGESIKYARYRTYTKKNQISRLTEKKGKNTTLSKKSDFSPLYRS